MNYITLSIDFGSAINFVLELGNTIYDLYLEKNAGNLIKLTVSDAGAIKAAFENKIASTQSIDELTIEITGDTN